MNTGMFMSRYSETQVPTYLKCEDSCNIPQNDDIAIGLVHGALSIVVFDYTVALDRVPAAQSTVPLVSSTSLGCMV
jgi:hypothetical protein